MTSNPKLTPSEDVQDHRDLRVWRRSYELGLAVYRATQSFPDHEKFGLSSQLRRAALSPASNIAEGRARQSSREFIRFLSITAGSLAELDTQIRFASDLGYLTPGAAGRLLLDIDECRRLVGGMIRSLRRTLDLAALTSEPTRPNTRRRKQSPPTKVDSESSKTAPVNLPRRPLPGP